jgi:hypothetical protein
LPYSDPKKSSFQQSESDVHGEDSIAHTSLNGSSRVRHLCATATSLGIFPSLTHFLVVFSSMPGLAAAKAFVFSVCINSTTFLAYRSLIIRVLVFVRTTRMIVYDKSLYESGILIVVSMEL